MSTGPGGGIDESGIRVNEQIGTSPVRLIDEEGGPVGIVSLETARRRAAEKGLDLVEVSPGSRPPVVRLMEPGRFARGGRSREQAIPVKEMKLHPGIEPHEYEFKIRHARRFIEEGCRVELTMGSKSGQAVEPDPGLEFLKRMEKDLEDVATVESRSGGAGRTLTMTLAPLERS